MIDSLLIDQYKKVAFLRGDHCAMDPFVSSHSISSIQENLAKFYNVPRGEVPKLYLIIVWRPTVNLCQKSAFLRDVGLCSSSSKFRAQSNCFN